MEGVPDEPDRDLRDYPSAPAEPGRVEPAPRRIRGYVGGHQVFDTVRARYVWDWPFYPQYAVHPADVGARLVPDDRTESLPNGTAHGHTLEVGEKSHSGAALVYADGATGDLAGWVRFAWSSLDTWFEEDEPIYVHPRNPYVRVDALRSHRHVRVELDGVLLAESHAPVLLFETGLPTRYYLDRADVDFTHLRPSDTQTPCPYKGRTSAYWSVEVDGRVPEDHTDLAWTYDYPTGGALPVAGMVAFYNERVDLTVDDVRLERPRTHF